MVSIGKKQRYWGNYLIELGSSPMKIYLWITGAPVFRYG
jgi:hypothetical protein